MADMELRAQLVAVILLAAAACSSDAPAPGAVDDTWVGTITSEADVTTVINESGSVWGGPAALVEEASIGVDAGADEYMFGRVSGVWATEDRILVLDSQIPVVRVYGLDGEHVLDVGRRGQGPGEFMEPGGVAVTRAGDILVLESDLQVDVFDPDGKPKATWNAGSPFQVAATEMLILGNDDLPWVPSIDMETRRFGRAKIGPDGTLGDPIYPPELDRESACLTYRRGESERSFCNIPFQPFPVSTLTPEGAWVVGVNDTYAFEVRVPDGSMLRVERFWTPVAVTRDEADYRRRQTTDMVRDQIARDPAWTWNGPEIPDHKPAYLQLMPDRNGRIWSLREKPSRQSTDCAGETAVCWIPEGYWLDAFGSDGRFLGSAELDRRPTDRPFIDDDTLVAPVADDAGTIMVKRYRLSLPGEEGR